MNEEIMENAEVPESVEIPESVEVPEPMLEQAADGAWRHAENSPFSPFYVPDRKNRKNNGITIGLVVVLLIMLICGLIFAVSKLVEAAAGEVSVAWNNTNKKIEDFIGELKEGFEEEKPDYFADDYDNEDWEDFLKQFEDEYGYESDGDDYADDYYGDDFGSSDNNDNYEASPDDEYYETITNSIRHDLSYGISFEPYFYSDDAYSYISIWYAQIQEKGDKEIPYCDKINEYLKEGAMYYAYKFEEAYEENFTLFVESYVTYMDEDILSVVVDERYAIDGVEEYSLYCMNFDLKTGSLMYNTDIIDVTDEMVQAFIEQNDYQNNGFSLADSYTEEEIMDYMSDEETLILFYTPVGLEVGYNHRFGWVTVTFKDYEKYLKKL